MTVLCSLKQVQAGAETIAPAGPVNTQQPGTRYSFVQEHFQAQYR